MNNSNTIFGWILFSGIIALGFSILSGKYFHANDMEAPETPGFAIAGEAEDGGGAAAEMTMAAALNMMPQDELVAAGEAVFAKCIACHTIEQGGANGIGPNLYGIMGKDIASIAGFAYSDALSAKEGGWTWDEMNAWLKSPRGYANGTKMSFAGLSSIEDRAAVALYMNSFGSNIALPEYVEAVAAEGEAAEGEAVAEEGAEEAAAEATEAEEAASE